MPKRSSADFLDLDLLAWARIRPEERGVPYLSRLGVAARARLARVEKRNRERPGGALLAAALEAEPVDDAEALEAIRPFAQQIVRAERRRRQRVAAGWAWTQATAADWLLEFGEEALWMPEFWSFLADLAAVASHDPGSGVRRQDEREPEEFRMPREMLAVLRGIEAHICDAHRGELAAVLSALRGKRQTGRPRGTRKASREGATRRATLLADYESLCARIGDHARAVATLARRKDVTPDAIRSQLRKAREERRDRKPT